MSIQTWYGQHVIRKENLLCDLEQFYSQENEIKNSDHPLLRDVRKKPKSFPQLFETQVVRHFHRLAKINYSWEDGLYPLGSCTMKYNPVINEKIASDPQIVNLHPDLPSEKIQGMLQLIYEAQESLRIILDLAGLSLLPAAGAHGEYIGVQMTRAYFDDKNEKRNVILIPDSAHGTNPASAATGGFEVQKVNTLKNGLTDLEDLKSKLTNNVALFMLTNPNTMGIFEANIVEIKKMLENNGTLLYIDGANLNAFVGKASLGEMGADLIQLNLHKTFSTPHGGGGPGQGAIGCSARMLDFLPNPYLQKKTIVSIDGSQTHCENKYVFEQPKKTIGMMKGSYGQFGMIVRAWAYLVSYGNSIKTVAENAVVNSNYLRQKLSKYLDVSSELPTLHEAVFSQKTLQDKGLTTLNLAKALLDRGFYAPTVYFPLNINGAIMVEPTETETKAELDTFVAAVKEIFEKIDSNPQEIKSSPNNTHVTDIDEVVAARKPILTWNDRETCAQYGI